MDNQIGLGYTRETAQDNLKMLSKLFVPMQDRSIGTKQNKKAVVVNQEELDKKVASSVQSRMDASAMMQMLPDLELCKRILIGMVLSPKDLYTTEVGFTGDAERFGPEITRGLLELVEKYVVDKLKINDRLEQFLERALFKEGAAPVIVLPENNLDSIINKPPEYNPGLEQYARQLYVKRAGSSMGFLGFPKASMEEHNASTDTIVEHTIFPGISVTDNVNVLKENGVNHSLRSARISERFSQESESGMTEEEIAALYNKPIQATADSQAEVLSEFGLGRRSSGCPLVEMPPASAVLPITTPGRPDQHAAYWVILNDKGTYVSGEEDRNYHEEIRNRYNAAGDNETSDVTQQVRAAMGMKQDETFSGVDKQLETFGPLIESQLIELMRRGMYQEELDFEFTQNVKRVMLQRALHGRRTRILFVPKELVTYVAFDYNNEGVGVSLLTKTAIIGSMRMAMTLAHNMGQLRNAVSRRKVNIELDEDEVDPMKTINDVQNMILEQTIKSYPLSASDPVGMMRALQLSGFDFSYNGGGMGMPKTKVEFEDWVSQDQGGNTEYEDRLRNQHIMGLNMMPEFVDPNQSPDFAVEAINNNLMMAKTVRHLQKTFTRDLTNIARTFCKFSGDFKRECIKIIEDNRSTIGEEFEKHSISDFVNEFLDAMEVTLPSPDRSRTGQQAVAYQEYKTLLDVAFEAYISSDIIPAEMLGDNPKGTVDQAIAILKAKYLRDWMAENNVMPELDMLLEMGDDDKPKYNIFDIQEPIVSSVVAAMKEYLDKVMPEMTGGFDAGGDSGDMGDDGFGGDETDEAEDGDMEGDMDSEDGLDDLEDGSDNPEDADTEDGSDSETEESEDTDDADEKESDEEPSE